MKPLALLVLGLSLVGLGCGDAADTAGPAISANSAKLVVEGARIMPTGGVAALYVTIKAPQGDRLLRASSSAGGQLELHETVLDGDMVRMQPRPDGFELVPGETFELRPGGPHAMWMGRNFETDERVPLVLHFEDAGAVETTALVEAMGGGSASASGHGDHGNHQDHGGHEESGHREKNHPSDGEHSERGSADSGPSSTPPEGQGP